MYLPTKITIYSGVEYILHGRVYSTAYSGSHFFVMCYTMINDVKYLVRIDNLDAKIKIVSSDMEKARKFLKHYRNTVYACYKKIE
jgi:hypothetical protein